MQTGRERVYNSWLPVDWVEDKEGCSKAVKAEMSGGVMWGSMASSRQGG